MILHGFQSQFFQSLAQVARDTLRDKSAVIKLIDGDGDTFRAIKDASPNSLTIYRMYTGMEDKARWSETYGREYARNIQQRLGNAQQFVTYVESENEQTVFNVAEAQRLNQFNYGFCDECQKLGMRPIVCNFPEGHPEVFAANTDYQTWPDIWQALAPGLRACKNAKGALGVHEYGAPTMRQDWSDVKKLGYRCGRHRAVIQALPADLKDMPIIITETGIDWLIQGVVGGYAHNGGTIEAFTEQLKWYESICAPNVIGVAQFGFQLFGVNATDEANSLMQRLQADRIESYRRRYPALNIVSAEGIDWSEYDPNRDSADRKTFIAWLGSGAAIVPPPPPPPDPTKDKPLMRTAPPLPQGLADLGFKVKAYQPTPDEKFWAFLGVSDYKIGAGTETVVTLREGNGTAFGIPVYNMRPDGKFEVFTSDGIGQVKYDLGPGSRFEQGQEPINRIFVGEGGESGETPPTIKGDVLYIGFPLGGNHFESKVAFQLTKLEATAGLPVIKTDDELRAYVYSKAFQGAVSFLPTAAFTLKARELNLGEASSSEFRYLDGAGVKWAAQAFALDILKCVEGQWDRMTKVSPN